MLLKAVFEGAKKVNCHSGAVSSAWVNPEDSKILASDKCSFSKREVILVTCRHMQTLYLQECLDQPLL